MTEDVLNKLALAAVSDFDSLDLESKIISLRYASDVAEITPDKLGQVLEGLKEAAEGNNQSNCDCSIPSPDSDAASLILNKFKINAQEDEILNAPGA